jgi:hypothetical protein
MEAVTDIEDPEPELQVSRKRAKRVTLPVSTGQPVAADTTSARFFEYGEIRAIRYVIPGYIPRGSVTLIASPRNAGKTTAVLHLAAIGSLAKDQCEGQAPIRTWLNTREDDLRSVIRPRLHAARADQSCLVAATDERWILPDDLPEIEKSLEEHKYNGSPDDMLILDSVSMHMRNHRDNNSARATMDGLARLAVAYDMAVLLVGHTTKGKMGSVEAEIAGSTFLQSLSKSIFVYGDEPGGTERKVLACERTGYGRQPDSLLFEVDTRTVEGVGECPYLRYLEPCEWTSRDTLKATKSDKTAGELAAESATKTQLAANWIAEVLSDGPMPSADFEAQAKADGAFFSKNTFSAARQELGVISRPGEGGRIVSLPPMAAVA